MGLAGDSQGLRATVGERMGRLMAGRASEGAIGGEPNIEEEMAAELDPGGSRGIVAEYMGGWEPGGEGAIRGHDRAGSGREHDEDQTDYSHREPAGSTGIPGSGDVYQARSEPPGRVAVLAATDRRSSTHTENSSIASDSSPCGSARR